MKHRNIKERRAFKNEFAYLNRVEIMLVHHLRQVHYKKHGFTMKLLPREESLVSRIRNEIGYSPKTNDYDILHSIFITTKDLLTSEPLQKVATLNRRKSTYGRDKPQAFKTH